MVEERVKDYSSTPAIQENLKRCFFVVVFNREGAVIT